MNTLQYLLPPRFDAECSPAPGVPEFWADYELCLSRGCSCASSGGRWPLFEDTPILVVSKAKGRDWKRGAQEFFECWLFFRNREEWRKAYRRARSLRKLRRYSFLNGQIHFPMGLPAVKPPGGNFLWINGPANPTPARPGVRLLTNRAEAA